MESKMTPCAKLGYKVGNRFRVLNKSLQESYDCKDEVSLFEDDGSCCPIFTDGEKDYLCFGIDDGDLEPISITTLKTGDEITQDGKKYRVTLEEIPQYDFKPGMICRVDWSKADASCFRHSNYTRVVYIKSSENSREEVAYSTIDGGMLTGYVNTSSLRPE